MSDKPIVIIRKKKLKVVNDKYQGGTWKIAYADFITAMMAFFLLLWLVSVTPEETQRGIVEYFTTADLDSSGLGSDGGLDENINKDLGNASANSRNIIYGSPSTGRQMKAANGDGGLTDSEKRHFLEMTLAIQKSRDLQEFIENLNVDVTTEGIRIQIMNTEHRPVFKPNTDELQPYMNKLLFVIGELLKDQPNYLAFTGHTATVKDEKKDHNVDDWALSAMRANTLRKFFVDNESISAEQVSRVIGKSSTEPFDLHNQYNPKNIRVTIVLLKDAYVNAFQKVMPRRKLQ